jgi:hypothetical protein
MEQSNLELSSVSFENSLPENNSPKQDEIKRIFIVNDDSEPHTVSNIEPVSKTTNTSSDTPPEFGNQTYYADELVPVPGLGNVRIRNSFNYKDYYIIMICF